MKLNVRSKTLNLNWVDLMNHEKWIFCDHMKDSGPCRSLYQKCILTIEPTCMLRTLYQEKRPTDHSNKVTED